MSTLKENPRPPWEQIRMLEVLRKMPGGLSFEEELVPEEWRKGDPFWAESTARKGPGDSGSRTRARTKASKGGWSRVQGTVAWNMAAKRHRGRSLWHCWLDLRLQDQTARQRPVREARPRQGESADDGRSFHCRGELSLEGFQKQSLNACPCESSSLSFICIIPCPTLLHEKTTNSKGAIRILNLLELWHVLK